MKGEKYIMEKKKMSKKKKIIIIISSVFVVLFSAIIGGGVYALNWYCAPIEAEKTLGLASYDKDNSFTDVKLIAHRGLSAMAPENTVASTEKAGEAGYWGAETDIYRTTDGVWVLMHDNYLYRMMEGSGIKKVETMTYDELMEYTYTNGANIQDYPNLKVSLLADFLDTCKKHNMKAVIEYKSKNNLEYVHEVVAMIKEKDMVEESVIISFKIEALRAFQEHTNDEIPLWYLTHKMDDEAIEEAKTLGDKAGIEFNATNGKNTKEMAQKAKKQGLDLGCWTIDEFDLMEDMIDWGVTYMTTNRIIPESEKVEI